MGIMARYCVLIARNYWVHITGNLLQGNVFVYMYMQPLLFTDAYVVCIPCRQSLNGLLKSPLIRVHKNVVHESAMLLDNTPVPTPRVSITANTTNSSCNPSPRNMIPIINNTPNNTINNRNENNMHEYKAYNSNVEYK